MNGLGGEKSNVYSVKNTVFQRQYLQSLDINIFLTLNGLGGEKLNVSSVKNTVFQKQYPQLLINILVDFIQCYLNMEITLKSI